MSSSALFHVAWAFSCTCVSQCAYNYVFSGRLDWSLRLLHPHRWRYAQPYSDTCRERECGGGAFFIMKRFRVTGFHWPSTVPPVTS